ERGVAAADRRLAGEHAAKAPLAREVFERRTGVGDGDELLAAPAGPLPEVVRVRDRLERRARLGRGDEQRPLEVERLVDVTDQRGMGRVEDVQLLVPERSLQDLRR